MQQVSGVGAFAWSSLRWFQLAVVQMKKEFFNWLVLEWGTGTGLEFKVTCL